RAGQDLHAPITGNPHLYLIQWPRRRTPRDRTVRVVHAAVTRTQEQLGLRTPVDRTPQVCAIDRKRGEVRFTGPPEPDRRTGRLAGPWQRRRIVVGHLNGFTNPEIVNRADIAPHDLRGLQQRTQEVSDDWNANDRGGNAAQGQTDARQEPAPAKQV